MLGREFVGIKPYYKGSSSQVNGLQMGCRLLRSRRSVIWYSCVWIKTTLQKRFWGTINYFLRAKKFNDKINAACRVWFLEVIRLMKKNFNCNRINGSLQRNEIVLPKYMLLVILMWASWIELHICCITNGSFADNTRRSDLRYKALTDH